MTCLSEDGNLFDAATIATVAALSTTKLPKVSLPETSKSKSDSASSERYKIIDNAEKIPLALSFLIIPSSFALVNGFIVQDPTSEEEKLSDCSLIVIHDSEGRFVSFLKPGGTDLKVKNLDGLAVDESSVISSLVSISSERIEHMKEILQTALSPQ